MNEKELEDEHNEKLRLSIDVFIFLMEQLGMLSIKLTHETVTDG